MSDAFVIIKVCYVHNLWYDISCATLYEREYFKLSLLLSQFHSLRHTEKHELSLLLVINSNYHQLGCTNVTT